MNMHGDADSHIDALCHVIYDGTLYNGVPAGTVSPGAAELSIEVAEDGIVGRGVLLDIPRLRGVPWLEPGDHVTADDLAAAEQAQQVRVGRGDLLFVRVGHRRRRGELGPWDAAADRAGLHPTALEFVADRQVAVLGSDSNSDTRRQRRGRRSTSPCTCWRSTRSACTCSTTCSSRTWYRRASRRAAGRSCASSPRCGCPAGPAPRSIPSPSCSALVRRASRCQGPAAR